MSTILFQLKGSPQIIEDVLENVSKVRNNQVVELFVIVR